MIPAITAKQVTLRDDFLKSVLLALWPHTKGYTYRMKTGTYSMFLFIYTLLIHIKTFSIPGTTYVYITSGTPKY
jgi:hypothetical protein